MRCRHDCRRSHRGLQTAPPLGQELAVGSARVSSRLEHPTEPLTGVGFSLGLQARGRRPRCWWDRADRCRGTATRSRKGRKCTPDAMARRSRAGNNRPGSPARRGPGRRGDCGRRPRWLRHQVAPPTCPIVPDNPSTSELLQTERIQVEDNGFARVSHEQHKTTHAGQIHLPAARRRLYIPKPD